MVNFSTISLSLKLFTECHENNNWHNLPFLFFNEYDANIAVANFCVNEKYKAFYALHSDLIKNLLFYFNNTITYVLYVAHFANLYEYLLKNHIEISFI